MLRVPRLLHYLVQLTGMVLRLLGDAAHFLRLCLHSCRSRILTASAENLNPSILRGHILYEKSGREGYKPLRRRFRRAGLRSGWGAVDCVGSDHSRSS
jgi:hypothetical protein